MIQDNYINNTAINDLNLSLTNDDLQTLNGLDDDAKKILNLQNLVSDEQQQANENAQVDNTPPAPPPSQTNAPQAPTGAPTAPSVTQQAVSGPDPTTQTTIDPGAMMRNAVNVTNQKDPFAPYQQYLDPKLVPEASTRRYRETGYVYGRNNEDWAAKNEGFWTNLGKGLVRLPLSIGIKTGQSIGFISGLLNPTNWGSNYIDNASKNAMAEVFNNLDEKMKQDWLPVYEKADAQGKGFWWRATHDMNFWTNDFVDGAAFMVSAYAPGGILSKLGLGERVAKGLSALKWGADAAETAVEGAATAQNYLSKAQSVWATRINKYAQWGLSVAGESMFEATQVGDNIKKGLTYNDDGTLRIDPETGLPYTEQKKKEIAASHMKSTFLSNAALLSVTNAMELKWINSMMGKAESRALTRGLSGGAMIGDELAFKLSNIGVSRLINSKVGNFLYGLGKGTLMEGFVEENAQLAIQRINEQYGIEGKVAQFKDNKDILSKWASQTVGALSGKDPEASISIGLGGVLGGGMSAVSQVKEFSRDKKFTEQAVKFYNEAQKNWLKFGNIFVTRQITEKDEQGNDVTRDQIVLNKDGNPIIDEDKLMNVANNFNNANSAIEASNMIDNKIKRDLLRDSAWADFVKAHIELGMEQDLFAKLGAIERTSPGDLAKLGFIADATTPQQIEKYKNLTDLIIKQNKLMNDDIIFETDWKGNIKPEEEARRHRMMELATQQAVFKNLVGELTDNIQTQTNEFLKNVEFGQSSLSDGLVDQLNDLSLRISSQRQMIDYFKSEKKKPIEMAMAKTVLNDLISQMSDLKKQNQESFKKLRKGEDGLYKYENENRNSEDSIAVRNKIYGFYMNRGQLQNQVKQNGLEWAKYADTKNGKKNFKDYIDNVIVKPLNEASERAEIGKSSKLTDEERAQRRKDRQGKEYERRQPWTKRGVGASFLYRMKDDDRVGEDIIEYYGVQDGEVTDAISFIKKAIDNPYTDPYLKRILSRLLPFVKPQFKIKFDTKQTIAPGFYTLGSDMITLDPELHEAQLSFEGVLLHELIHQLTSDELADKGLFTKNIEELYNYTKSHLESRGIDTSYYGFTNVHEFLAEAYSNPEFQRELASVPGKTGFTSIWTDFLASLYNFFKRAFNMELKPSVLDDIFFKVEEYLNDNVYNIAKQKLLNEGLTDDELERYSRREIIDLALKEGLITDELLQPEYKQILEQKQQQQQQTEQGEETTAGEEVKFDESIEYTYKGKNYNLLRLDDKNVFLISRNDPDDVFSFTTDQFLQALATEEVKPATQKKSEDVASTLEEHLEKMYNKAKTIAEQQGRTVPTFEIWKKGAGKYETARYEKLKGAQSTATPTPAPSNELASQVEALEKEKKEKVNEMIQTLSQIIPVSEDTPLQAIKDTVEALGESELIAPEDFEKAKNIINEIEKLNNEYDTKVNDVNQGISRNDILDVIKLNNEFLDLDGNTIKITSIVPDKMVGYVNISPDGNIITGKLDFNAFVKAVNDGMLTLQKDVYEQGDDDFTEDVVKDYVQNDRFDNTGLRTTSTDNNASNVTLQEGPRQIAPHNSLANSTDITKEEMIGGQMRRIRDGVNNNYTFDVATSNFLPGKAVVYKLMVKDFPEVKNNITGEVYNQSKIYSPDGKVRPEMFDYVPIGVYTMIEGKEVLIGTLHEPQWIERKVGSTYANIVVPASELSQPYPDTVKKEVFKNRELRNFIIENFNKNPNFEMNAVVEKKSIGILRTITQPGVIKDRVNPKIGEGGTENRHGMFGIVRNGTIEVSRNVEIDNLAYTETFNGDNIKASEGTSVLLLPTPTGTYFPTFVKLPKVNTDQAVFILSAWKAFTGQEENPELIKAVYNALGLTMSEGNPDIGVLQRYVNHYITILESDELSSSGTGVEVKAGTARLNITNKGHLYFQVKTKDAWIDNGGKPYVKASELPDDMISLMSNLLTTIKFTDKSNRSLVGINSTKKIPFVSIENGKVVTKMMTYNEYIMQNASTYVENGIPSKNKDGDWVYFANPVIKMSTSEVSLNDGDANPVVKPQPKPSPEQVVSISPVPLPIQNGTITITAPSTDTFSQYWTFTVENGKIVSGVHNTYFQGEYRDRRTQDPIKDLEETYAKISTISSYDTKVKDTTPAPVEQPTQVASTDTRTNVEKKLREIAVALDDEQIKRVLDIPIEKIIKEVKRLAAGNPNTRVLALPMDYANRLMAELRTIPIPVGDNTKLTEIVKVIDRLAPTQTIPVSTDTKDDIEKRRQEELKKEFGRNLDLVKSGKKPVISRNADLVKLSSDPEVSDARAQEVIDKYNAINAKYDEELKALETKPEVSTDVITDEVYNTFIDKNTVPENILNSIADKVMNRAPLSQRETAIFTGKTSEINDIIRKKAPASTNTQADIEAKKADIERRRQEALKRNEKLKVQDLKTKVAEKWGTIKETSDQLREYISNQFAKKHNLTQQQIDVLIEYVNMGEEDINSNPFVDYENYTKEQRKKYNLRKRTAEDAKKEWARFKYKFPDLSQQDILKIGAIEDISGYIAREQKGALLSEIEGKSELPSNLAELNADKINAEFDAELAALETTPAQEEEVKTEPAKKLTPAEMIEALKKAAIANNLTNNQIDNESNKC